MKVPDLTETKSALALIGTHTIHSVSGGHAGWELKKKSDSSVDHFDCLVDVWCEILKDVASILNNHQRRVVFLEAFQTASPEFRTEMKRMISKYHNSPEDRKKIEELLWSSGYKMVSPDNLPEDWKVQLANIVSLGKAGYSLPAQVIPLIEKFYGTCSSKDVN